MAEFKQGRNKEMPIVKHVLADGTELDSIDGFVIPYNKQTEGIYYLVAAIINGDKRFQQIPEHKKERRKKTS